MFWIILIVIVVILIDKLGKSGGDSQESLRPKSRSITNGNKHRPSSTGIAQATPRVALSKPQHKHPKDFDSVDVEATPVSDKTPQTAEPYSFSQREEDYDSLQDINDFLNQEDKRKANPIANALAERGIERVLHFTRTENLRSIANNGLLSVQTMRRSRLKYRYNDAIRLDGKLNAISLSITHPNSAMFYKYRVRDARGWVVLELEPSVIFEVDCQFCFTNAASQSITALASRDLVGIDAFERMFVGSLDPRYPTDVQAEVLCMADIPPRYIKSVKVENSWFKRQAEKLQLPFPVEVDRTLFDRRPH